MKLGIVVVVFDHHQHIWERELLVGDYATITCRDKHPHFLSEEYFLIITQTSFTFSIVDGFFSQFLKIIIVSAVIHH